MARMTQKEIILRHLQDGNRISSAVCFREYGFTDLQSIIRTLKNEGYPIMDEWIFGVNRYNEPIKYKEYWLALPNNLLDIIKQKERR